MRSFLVLCLMAAVVMGAARKVTPIPLTRSDGAIEVTTKDGRGFLATREMLAEVTYPDRADKADVFIAFDKPRRLFFWIYRPLSRNGLQETALAQSLSAESRVYLADDRLVLFVGGVRTTVAIHESSRRANSLEDAENRALREIGDLEGSGLARLYQDVPMPLPRDFFAPKFSAAPGRFTLLGISRVDSKWELLVQGHWKAKIILDENYEVTGWKRIQ